MARIAIVTHPDDRFTEHPFLLRAFVEHWTEAGHQFALFTDPDRVVRADVVVLHVDLTVVPAAYAALADRFPKVVNGRALDIRKSTVSRTLLSAQSDWAGPVIVKTDLNCGGIPELTKQQLARRAGRPDPSLQRVLATQAPYPIYPSLQAVPSGTWSTEGLVVERFLPERDEAGHYWVRAWTFFGDRERCTRYRSPHPIVKGANIVERVPAEVPEDLRAERARLGIDYGKLDFVVQDGKSILFDANKTPAAPPPHLMNALRASNIELARGIDRYLGSSP